MDEATPDAPVTADAPATPDAPVTPDAPPIDAPIDAPMQNVEAPVNATTSGTVAEAGTMGLSGKLVSADADTGAGELVYTVQALPARGTLSNDGTELTVGGTFSQQDVNDGKLSYAHDGSESAADTFTWSLSDGVHTIPATGANTFAITVTPVNDLPTIVNNPVTSLAEGGISVLTTSRLQAADAENSTLTYTVLSVTRGQVQKNNVALAVNGTFTQQDIDGGLIRFVDPGTDDANLANKTSTSGGFQWKVSDPDGGVNPMTGANSTMFTITPVDDAPTITWDVSRCAAAGVMNVPADPFVTLTDVDNALSEYSVCVVSITDGFTYQQVTTTLGGTATVTVTVVPVLQNNAVNIGVGACVPANARSGLNLDSGATDYRGEVTWRLLRGAVEVGTQTVTFNVSTTPC